MEIMLYLGIVIFAIIMLVVTTKQNRNEAKRAAESIGNRLNNLKTDKNDTVEKKEYIKPCSICNGEIYRDGNVYICKECGTTYNETEI